jgi:hypothetical protein
MIARAVVLLALAGCSTRLLDPIDLSPAPAPADLAVEPVDLATGDLAAACGSMNCGTGERCIFLNRGDCSRYLCMAAPAQCSDAFCAQFDMGGEKLTCAPPGSWPPGALVCNSTIQCV